MTRTLRDGIFCLLMSVLLLGAPAMSAADGMPAGQDPAAEPHRAPRVVWAEDVSWSEIVTRARRADQPIFIDFYATWCGPCKLLDAMVYNEAEVMTALEDVITFKVDIDKPRYGWLKAAFDIEVLPTLIWCDPDGGEFARFTGYHSADNFLARIDDIARDQATLATALEQLRFRPQDPELLLAAADLSTARGDTARAEVLYRRLVVQRPAGARALVVARGMLGLSGLEFAAGRPDEARLLTRQAAEQFAAGEADFHTGLREVAAQQAAVGDTTGALASYRLLVELDDMDIGSLTGYARATTVAGVELEEGSRAALRAVVISDEDPVAVGVLAECYYRRGLYRKAIKWIKKSIDTEPETLAFRDQLMKFESALERDPWQLRGASR